MKQARSGCCEKYTNKERTKKKVVYNMDFFNLKT
jgi:hypothetical protein